MKTYRMNRFYSTNLSVLCMYLFVFTNVYAGQYVKVSPDLDIYYEESGTGTPIIFIPGYTATTWKYKAQVAHFSNNYRAISYDPRGQGLSSKTLDNNTTTQHGADLKAFMDTLTLKDVVLVAHSMGCAFAYAYFSTYGTENVKSFVCIDQPPKVVIEKEGDWGIFKFPDDFKTFIEGMYHDRLNYTRAFIPTMISRQLTANELDKFTNELMKTPNYVAIPLWLYGNMMDYSADARMIDGKIPVLYVLMDKEGYTNTAKKWLTDNMPKTRIEAFGLHSMFWEFPDRFNAIIDDFLNDPE